jgi:N-acetylmuramoyl-L-alanine amidase
MKIITREEWKARPHKNGGRVPHIPTKITIHHQGSGNPKDHVMSSFKGAETIRGIQKFHMESRGYTDIAYHAIIAPNGDIYEGRPFGVAGAHVKNRNTGNIGIMLIGNFEVEKPTDIQLSTLKEVIKYVGKLYPTIPIPTMIFGHKEWQYTDCPGANLYPFVLNIKFGKEKL